MVSSGISPPFGRLSRSRRQVTYVLLTRAPLYSRSCPRFLARLACVRHAASVRSEPGSNSPVKSRSPEGLSGGFDPAFGLGRRNSENESEGCLRSCSLANQFRGSEGLTLLPSFQRPCPRRANSPCTEELRGCQHGDRAFPARKFAQAPNHESSLDFGLVELSVAIESDGRRRARHA